MLTQKKTFFSVNLGRHQIKRNIHYPADSSQKPVLVGPLQVNYGWDIIVNMSQRRQNNLNWEAEIFNACFHLKNNARRYGPLREPTNTAQYTLNTEYCTLNHAYCILHTEYTTIWKNFICKEQPYITLFLNRN